jgi:nucleotide-binding universal stress UspA family protein
MVVLLDGSEVAEVVFGYAQAVAGRLGLDLELLHVASSQEATQLPMRRVYMDHMARELCGAAEEIRKAGGGADTGRCIEGRGTVVVGDAAEEILRYVRENDSDLVMMATRGSSGIKKDWGLGSVVRKILHAVEVPVWLVPAELRKEVVLDALPKRAMVIPLSGTTLSESVLPHALTMARQYGTNNELVLVWAGPQIAGSPAGRIRERKRMAQYLKGIVASICEAGVEARFEILEGRPADAIIEFIKSNPTQLLAMATHSRTALGSLVFDSLAEHLIHMIKVTPMLLVPAKERATIIS